MVTLPLTVLSVVVGAAAAVGAWWGARTSGRRALVTASVLGAKGLIAASVLTIGLVRGRAVGFRLMHLWYLVGTVAVPMVGAAFVVLARGRARAASFAAVGALLLVPAPVGWYATHVEPYRLRVQRVEATVPAGRDGHDRVRIAVLSDLQNSRIGDFEHRVVTRLLAERPDLILISGDVFQGDRNQLHRALPRLRDELGRLHAPLGVFLVAGDADDPESFPAMIEGTDVRVLAGEVVELRHGDRTIRLGGHPLDYTGPEAERTRRELEATADDGAITILLAHRPDTVLHLADSSRVDLTVAGHTHGGQVVVPGFGPLVTMTDVPRDVARGGLHRIDGNQIYVSPGVGMERFDAPQLRLFDPPTIGIVEIG